MIVAQRTSSSKLRPAPLALFIVDQLDEDLLIGRPDFEVEVSEEVHADEPIDILVSEREYSERKIRRRHAERGEFGHAKPVIMLFPDGEDQLAVTNEGARESRHR